MVGRAGVGPVQVLEEDHLLFEAAAAQHAGRPAAVADPGAVGQTGADAAQSAELIQAGRGSSPDQLDGSGGILTDKTLRRNRRNQRRGVRVQHLNNDSFSVIRFILADISWFKS